MHDIIIIGAGTAGLSAAIYARRAGKSVLIFEEAYYGGQIANTPHVENYPGIKQISGFDFANDLYEQAMALGTEIEFVKVERIQITADGKLVLAGEKEYSCKTVILATGAKNRPIGLEREKELTGKGISYCATCDGAFYRGKTVAVVGGGNTAVNDVIHLSEICKKVYLIHRREELRAEKQLQDKLTEKSNVEQLFGYTVTKLSGSERLTAIEVKNVLSEKVAEITVDGVFVAIGQMPDNERFASLVELDDYGYIKAGEDCKTNVPGIFAAGDCRTKQVRQLTTAAADGSVAALAACDYIG